MSVDVHKKNYFPGGVRKRQLLAPGRGVPRKVRRANHGDQEELRSNYLKEFFYGREMIQGGRLPKEVRQRLYGRKEWVGLE